MQENAYISLNAGVGKLVRRGTDSRYSRLCGPGSICHRGSALPCGVRAATDDPWEAWLCDCKVGLTRASSWLDLQALALEEPGVSSVTAGRHPSPTSHHRRGVPGEVERPSY